MYASLSLYAVFFFFYNYENEFTSIELQWTLFVRLKWSTRWLRFPEFREEIFIVLGLRG